MRAVLIALILNFGTAVGAEVIRGSEAEQILVNGKILHAGSSTEGTVHRFTISYRKKVFVCQTVIRVGAISSGKHFWCAPFPR
tara:strand:+ start:406 stop:654 length:249 start_codon:yes stop_codon:yes gene_type:complete